MKKDSEYKCFFCGKYANYSLYLAGNIKELCAEHFRKAGQKTVVMRGKR